MRNSYKVAFFLAFAACLSFGQQKSNGIKLKVEMPTNNYILGEDPQLIEIWKNVGSTPMLIAYGADPSNRFTKVHVVGPIRKDCRGDWKMLEEGGLVPNAPKFEPGKVFRAVHSLRDYGVVDAGHYLAWIDYNTTSAPEYHRQAGLAPLHLESNHVEFDVVEPQGIDAEVFAKYTNNCHQITLGHSDLLKKYPTSTYAGYELLYQGPGFTMWDLVDLSDKNRDQHLAIPQGASIEKQDELRTKYLASYQSFLDKADKFLTLHPDFSERDLLRKEMANALFLLGRQDEALSQVKLVEAKEGPLAEEAKKTLQKAGVVKPSCKTKDKK